MGNILASLLRLPRKNIHQPKLEQIEFSKRAFCAARQGDVTTLEELMAVPACEGGLPLSAVRDEASGCTLLHVAVQYDHSACVKLLLSAGCDETTGDKSLETPLHVASMHDSISSLEAVLTAGHGVALEVRDIWRRTPLLKALVYRSERVMQMLLEMHANCNVQDIYGLSLVHVAASYGRADIIDIVARQGGNLNLLNEKRRPPLAVAITTCNPDVVAELIQLGASTIFPGSACAVVTAAKELIRRFEGGTVCESAEQVLHLVLAAHGCPLHTDERNVFLRVLLTADVKRFLPLLFKMHICSDCVYNVHHIWPSDPNSSSNHLQSAVSLLDLARRSARDALMASGHNVVWAVERLSVPPAMKGLLLLRDCDYKEVMLPLPDTQALS
ncbi:hypothetical protein BaRGS_00009448 [Batillaria attramentaria]|uniref:Ankyrin repeat protein n=1 Tax=Batillaria attramentaria TaxID=370345 RepID=A0ABD0LJA3_9CAEN